MSKRIISKGQNNGQKENDNTRTDNKDQRILTDLNSEGRPYRINATTEEEKEATEDTTTTRATTRK